MRTIPLVFLVLATGVLAGAQEEPARVLTDKIKDNHQVRLTEARISQARGQSLEARFVDVKAPDAEPFWIRFPAHSFTPHETTLMNIVRSSVNWDAPESRYESHEATLHAVFSIPKIARGYVTDYTKWWFVGFRPPGDEK